MQVPPIASIAIGEREGAILCSVCALVCVCVCLLVRSPSLRLNLASKLIGSSQGEE